MTEVNPRGQAAKTFDAEKIDSEKLDAEKIDSEKLDAEKLDSEKFYTEKHAQGAEECAHGGYVRSGYVQGESVQEKYAQKRARKFAAIDQQARASLAKIAPNPSRFCAKGAAGEANSAVKFAALTGSEIGSLPTVAADDIPQIFAAAREAGTHWRNVGFKERKRILSRFADEVLKFREEILDVLQWENGKSRGSAYEEVYDVLTNTLYYAKYAEKFLRPRSVSGAVPILTRACVQYQPKGAVAVISPWNYPLTLAISDAAAALMAGNTVILKPDSLTPYSAIAAAALLARAGLPSGVFQIVIGSGRELGPAMIAECDYMMFTGSTATGKEIGALAGAQLVGYSAELGGKNAMIVRADAPVKRAAKAAAKASFASSGQLCVSMERIYIRSEIWDEFVSEFVRVTNKLKVDAALDWKSDIGPLISDTQVTKVLSHVQDAVAKGRRYLQAENCCRRFLSAQLRRQFSPGLRRR
ncbi:aldehyde dehydrogenase family protein [Arcanobacterium hippocoleae]